MSSKFKLSYDKGIRCGDDWYSIAIPDNFSLEKGAEDRAFIAWLPDGADDYFTADITLFDGKIAGENDNDSRLYTPEMCAALLEKMFWETPFLRMMSNNTKFIPLNEGYPAGGINASYDEDCFQYNIQLFFNGCNKTMRVQVMNVSEEDIPACDQMVIDWIKTMKMTKPMDIVKELDDSSFSSVELTEELVEEWKSCSDVRYTIIYQTLQNKIAARAARYKSTVGDGEDSDKEVRKDDQAYVEQAALEVSKYLISAVNGLEAITNKNEGNGLLQKLYEVLCPAIMQSDSVTMANLGGIKGKASARIPEYDEIKRRFMILMPNAEDKVEKKIPNPEFVIPAYSEKKEVLIGTMVAAIPDHMILAAEYHSDDESSEKFLDQLRNQYALVAIPDDFEKGFDFYTEGAFCINIIKPQQVSQFAGLFSKELKSEMASNMTNLVEGLLKHNGKYDEEFPAEFVCGGDEFGIVLEQVEENIDPVDNRSQFIFVVFHKSNFFQGNIYINAQGEREQFVSAIKEWLKKFRVADENTLKEYRKKQLVLALQECGLATEKGELDAIKVSQLFFDDVFFMNDYEVKFDGKHHKATAVQFNADVRYDYPTILFNLALLAPEIQSIMDAVETKDNLIIKKNEYHKNLQEVTWNQDITGTTIFNLCAFHMLKIVRGENDSYAVMIDSNLIDGLPEAYAYVAEFIRTLRDLNGMTGAFTAVMASFGNMNGGISNYIEKPIATAAKHEASVSMSVASGEYPYTKMKKEKADAEKRKAEEAKKAEEAEKKQYAANLESWNNRCSEIKAKREGKIKEAVAEEKARIENEAKAKYESTVAANQAVIDQQTKRKSEAEQVLPTLGMFKFGEKKAQRAIIEEAQKKIIDAKSAISFAESEYKNQLAKAAQMANDKEKSIRKTVEQKLPFPTEPKKPLSMLPATERENIIFKEAIREYLSNGQYCTINDLMENIPEISNLSNMRVSALVRQMVEAGILNREEVKRKVYFSLV